MNTSKRLWDCAPNDLPPGTKLYDADGNHVATLGERVYSDQADDFTLNYKIKAPS